MSSEKKDEKEKKDTCQHLDCNGIVISIGHRCEKKCEKPKECPKPPKPSPWVPFIVLAVLLLLSLLMTYGEQQSKPRIYQHYEPWPYHH